METLLSLPPELIHTIAFSPPLSFTDIRSLSLTCRAMASIFIHDSYGRNIHYALLGVGLNVGRKRFGCASLALARGWGEGMASGRLWRYMCKAVLEKRLVLETEEEVKGWSRVLKDALLFPQDEEWIGRGVDRELLLIAVAYVGDGDLTQWVLGKLGEWSGQILPTNSWERLYRCYELGAPLPLACSRGHVACVRILLQHGEGIEGLDVEINKIWPTYSASLLELAIETKSAHLVLLLLEHGHNPPIRGLPALFHACMWDAPEIVALLLENGAQADFVSTKSGDTPLIYACSSGGSLESVRILLDHGVEVNRWARNGESSLSIACQDGHLEIVSLLLQRGALVNNPDPDANPHFAPLRLAFQNGHAEIVALLVQHGGDLESEIEHALSFTLFDACSQGYSGIVKLLLERGNKPEESVKNGVSPLRRAASLGHADVVQVLVDSGVDINEFECPYGFVRHGRTPLMEASHEGGHLDVVRVLVQGGASLNDNLTGATALYYASSFGHTEIVRTLVEAGARVEDQCDGMYVPLVAAADHPDVVRILVEEGGADIHSIQHTWNFEWDDSPISAALKSSPESAMILARAAWGPPRPPKPRAESDSDAEADSDMDFWEDSFDGKVEGQLFFYACETGTFDVAQLLLERGWDPHSVVGHDHDSREMVPADAARGGRHYDIVDLIHEYDRRNGRITDE